MERAWSFITMYWMGQGVLNLFFLFKLSHQNQNFNLRE